MSFTRTAGERERTVAPSVIAAAIDPAVFETISVLAVPVPLP